MRSVFVYLLLGLALTELVCLPLILRRKSPYTRPIFLLVLFGLISTVLYGISIRFENYIAVVKVSRSLYYMMANGLTVFMYEYVREYTGIKAKKPYALGAVIFFAVLSGFSFLLNPWLGHAFTFSMSEYGLSQSNYWIMDIHPWFYPSAAFCYVVALVCLIMLTVRMVSTPHMYRQKYGTILVVFAITFAANWLSLSLRLPVDISVALYAALSVLICYFSLYAIPRALINHSNAQVVESLNHGILVFDYEGNCLSENEWAVQFFVEYEDMQSERQRVEYYRKMLVRLPEDEDCIEWERAYRRADADRYIGFHLFRLHDKARRHVGYYLSMEDHSEQVHALEREHYIARHDRLTGMYNRFGFFEQASFVIDEMQNIPLYIVAFNIKDFKLINDLFGSQMGDRVLCEQAKMLCDLAGEQGVCGRIGNDRFAMLLPRDEFDEARFLATLHSLQYLFVKSNYKLYFYLGIYELKNLYESVQSMYDKADMAISSIEDSYYAHVAYYDQQLTDQLLKENRIIADFDKALQQGQFLMYLQAQADVSARMTGCEALVRWMHPERGLVPPGEFLEVYERTGLIYRLDLYIWEQAAKTLRRWCDVGVTGCYISVNISVKDLYYIDVFKELTSLVERYQLSPNLLRLELTETTMITADVHADKLLERLHQYGFLVEIDDFGSGYSSLNMLKEMQADVLKIDMLFLRETANNERGRTILKTIITLGKQLGMEVVAEGVETREQFAMLCEMGCDMFQGYYFSKPIPVEDFEQKYLPQIGGQMSIDNAL